MPDIYFKSVPFSKEDVTLALESGVDGIITNFPDKCRKIVTENREA